jgi:hypothetical protein
MSVVFTRVSGENRIFLGPAHSGDSSKIQIDRGLRDRGPNVCRFRLLATLWETYRQGIGHVEL